MLELTAGEAIEMAVVHPDEMVLIVFDEEDDDA